MLDSLDHHAYGISGPGAADEVAAILEHIGFTTRGNPDFRVFTLSLLGIDEARSLKEAAYGSSLTGGKKVFVLSVGGITREAQNALLKIFEEPPKDTHFFLIVPSFDLLLPTLRSRLFLLQLKRGTMRVSDRAKAFLKDEIPIRLRTIQALLKKAENDAEKTDLVVFFEELETALAAEPAKDAKALGELLQAKRYIRDRAPSFKLLLEHLALVLPVVE